MAENRSNVAKAFHEGVELERQALHRTLYDAAVFKQDLTAAKFLLKHHHGYAPAAAPTKSTVNVNARGGVMVLPADISLEEWEKRAAQAQAELKKKVRE